MSEKSRLAGTFAALLVAMGMPAAAAAAQTTGTYVVASCAADGRPASASAWTASFSGYVDDPLSAQIPQAKNPFVDGCSEGGTFGIEFPEMIVASPLYARWTFTAPPETTVASVWLRRHVSFAGNAYLAGSPPVYTMHIDGGPVETLTGAPSERGSSALDASSVVSASGLSGRSADFEITCPSTTAHCGASDGAAVRLAEAQVTLRDDHAPVSTSSAWSASPDGTVTVSVGFTDAGGGVRRAALLIDGTERAHADLCQEPFVKPVPCPTDGQADLAVDPSLLYGDHSIESLLIDAAGNSVVSRLPIPSVAPIRVSDVQTQRPAPQAIPVVGHVAVSGRRTIRASYDSPPTLRGTVKTAAGAGIAGAVVSVGDAQTAKADAKGRFSVKLAKGPSREVRISYGDSVQTIKLIVAAPVRLKVDKADTRNGRSITFTGTVPGAANARTRVELQALAAGKWLPFKTAELKDGKFKASYRFTRTFIAQRYSFRAVIHDEPGFPYAAGRSNVVKVVVRP